MAAVRTIGGVLLALGPFFFAFLLFDATRGLFEGWLRVLGGVALGALGAAILLGVQLALIEPRLASLISLRAAGYTIPGAAIELFVIMLIFALAMIAMLIAVARVTYGLRLPDAWRVLPGQWAERLRVDAQAGPAAIHSRAVAPAADRSRAAAVADAVAATQRRESARPVLGEQANAVVAGPAGARSASVPRAASAREEPRAAPPPLGQSYRRTRNRTSPSAGRREGRA
jgi:type IV secretion system protein VirB6